MKIFSIKWNKLNMKKKAAIFNAILLLGRHADNQLIYRENLFRKLQENKSSFEHAW